MMLSFEELCVCGRGRREVGMLKWGKFHYNNEEEKRKDEAQEYQEKGRFDIRENIRGRDLQMSYPSWIRGVARTSVPRIVARITVCTITARRISAVTPATFVLQSVYRRNHRDQRRFVVRMRRRPRRRRVRGEKKQGE